MNALFTHLRFHLTQNKRHHFFSFWCSLQIVSSFKKSPSCGCKHFFTNVGSGFSTCNAAKHQKSTLFALLSFLLVWTGSFVSLHAQISGTVFADYNANGIRTTSNPSEPLVSGIIVTAYNSAGTILASFTTTSASAPNYSIPASGTAYNGTLGSNTGFVALGTV